MGLQCILLSVTSVFVGRRNILPIVDSLDFLALHLNNAVASNDLFR